MVAKTPECVRPVPSGEKRTCHIYDKMVLLKTCLPTYIAAFCPKENWDDRRLPYVLGGGETEDPAPTEPKFVKCEVCGLNIGADRDGTGGMLWTHITFGPLIKMNIEKKTDGVWEEANAGYLMIFLDEYDRVVSTTHTSHYEEVLMKRLSWYPPRFGVTGPKSKCCDKHKYTGVYAGFVPEDATQITIVPMAFDAGRLLALPAGAKSDVIDKTGWKKSISTAYIALTMPRPGHWGFDMMVAKALSLGCTKEGDPTDKASKPIPLGDIAIRGSKTIKVNNERSQQIRFTVLMDLDKELPATNCDKGKIAAALNSLVASAGLKAAYTQIEAEDVSEMTGLEHETIGELTLSLALPAASLALQALLVSVLAFLQ